MLTSQTHSLIGGKIKSRESAPKSYSTSTTLPGFFVSVWL